MSAGACYSTQMRSWSFLKTFNQNIVFFMYVPRHTLQTAFSEGPILQPP